MRIRLKKFEKKIPEILKGPRMRSVCCMDNFILLILKFVRDSS